MDLNERIKELIDSLKIKKVDFARRLNLSQSFVSELYSGKNNPSDRTILDICREFNVNETWLRTGEGEMFNQIARDMEISAFMGEVMKGEQETFKRRLISVLARMDETEWEILERRLKEIVDDL